MTRTPAPVTSPASGRRRVLGAAGVGLAAFVVYLLTLYPGVGGGGDAVKFQYVGSVLGTAHSPGYPLYVVVSYVFSLIPFGSLAYRINLMSAVCGAAAAAILFLTLARLRCHLVVAAVAALGLAYDRLLWGRSTGAEVYALNAALISLMLWTAVRWAETKRDRDLYAMVAVFALSLGNHLTVVSLVPALAAFVLLTSPRSVNVRTVVISVAIVALGVAQYLFIMLRTYQQAPHLEASARTLGELVEVMRASRYADQFFAFGWSDLVHQRVPQFWRWFVLDLTPIGVALFGAGLLMALRGRVREVVLFGGSAAGVVLLTLNIGADIDGFLVAACVPAWGLVGLGLQAVRDLIGASARPALIGIATAAMAVFPLWQLTRNYAPNDHHRRTYEMRYLEALFGTLEPKAAIVYEAYAYDQLILYKLIGERAAGNRSIRMTGPDRAVVADLAREGYAIYAFSNSRRELEGRGAAFEPVILRDLAGPAGALIDMAPMPLFRMLRASECQDVGNAGWRDITPLAADGRLMVRIDNYRPFDAVVRFAAGGGAGLEPPHLMISQGPAAPVIVRADDGRWDVPADPRLGAAATRSQAELRVNDRGDSVVSWLAWRVPPAVLWANAAVDLNNPRRAVLCNWSRADFFAQAATHSISTDEEGDAFFGQGWMAFELMNEGGHMRRTTGPDAEVLVPIDRPRRIRVRIQARALGTVEAHPVRLVVNGHTLPVQVIAHVWTGFEWDVPPEVWRTGLNRVVFESGDPAFPVGIAVSQLSFSRVD